MFNNYVNMENLEFCSNKPYDLIWVVVFICYEIVYLSLLQKNIKYKYLKGSGHNLWKIGPVGGSNTTQKIRAATVTQSGWDMIPAKRRNIFKWMHLLNTVSSFFILIILMFIYIKSFSLCHQTSVTDSPQVLFFVCVCKISSVSHCHGVTPP